VINLTLDQDKVEEKASKEFVSQGKDLYYLLFSWLRKFFQCGIHHHLE